MSIDRSRKFVCESRGLISLPRRVELIVDQSCLPAMSCVLTLLGVHCNVPGTLVATSGLSLLEVCPANPPLNHRGCRVLLLATFDSVLQPKLYRSPPPPPLIMFPSHRSTSTFTSTSLGRRLHVPILAPLRSALAGLPKLAKKQLLITDLVLIPRRRTRSSLRKTVFVLHF